MRINSPKLNIMHKACMKASRSLIRDFGEIENFKSRQKDLEILFPLLIKEQKKL